MMAKNITNTQTPLNIGPRFIIGAPHGLDSMAFGESESGVCAPA
jgi:hypothetical protein